MDPVLPVRVWVQEERACGTEDAALSVEDGDCGEAAEEPPELMPGDRTGQTATQNLEKNTPNYGIDNDALLPK